MDPVSVSLLVVAAVFLVGIAGELVFERTSIPDVVWLLLLGILLGPVFGLVERETLLIAAPHLGALALVVVLFDAGSELHLEDLGPKNARTAMLAGLGFALSLGVIAPAVMIGKWIGVVPASWGWMQAIALGAILAGSSSVVVMPALRRARVDEKLASMANLESALTDVLAVVCTGAIFELMAHRAALAAGTTTGSAILTMARSFGVGIIVGCVVGLLGALALRRLGKSDFAYPLMLGGLFLLYVVSQELGGSGALAILAAAVVIGNAPRLRKTVGLARANRVGSRLSGIHDPLSFVIKSFFFTFVGALLGPPWGALGFGIALGLLLILVRIGAVIAATHQAGMSTPARVLVAALSPRGMAAGALATLPLAMGVPDSEGIPLLVFAAITTTVTVFACGFPIVRRQLSEGELSDGVTGDETTASVPGWTIEPDTALPIDAEADLTPLAIAVPPPPPAPRIEEAPPLDLIAAAPTQRPPAMRTAPPVLAEVTDGTAGGLAEDPGVDAVPNDPEEQEGSEDSR